MKKRIYRMQDLVLCVECGMPYHSSPGRTQVIDNEQCCDCARCPCCLKSNWDSACNCTFGIEKITDHYLVWPCSKHGDKIDRKNFQWDKPLEIKHPPVKKFNYEAYLKTKGNMENKIKESIMEKEKKIESIFSHRDLYSNRNYIFSRDELSQIIELGRLMGRRDELLSQMEPPQPRRRQLLRFSPYGFGPVPYEEEEEPVAKVSKALLNSIQDSINNLEGRIAKIQEVGLQRFQTEKENFLQQQPAPVKAEKRK